MLSARSLNDETNVPKPPKCVHSITQCLVTLPIMSSVQPPATLPGEEANWRWDCRNAGLRDDGKEGEKLGQETAHKTCFKQGTIIQLRMNFGNYI